MRLSEPNVLVLDIAEYSFGDEAFKGPEEILRIDDELREKLGFPKRMEAWPQPWVSISKENNSNGKLELRYYIAVSYTHLISCERQQKIQDFKRNWKC